MLTIKQAAKIFNRATGSVDEYVKKKMIPKPVSVIFGNNRKARMWNHGAILMCVPNIEKFQFQSGGDNRTCNQGRKRRVKIDRSYRPPLTPAQKIVNSAFNLCLSAC